MEWLIVNNGFFKTFLRAWKGGSVVKRACCSSRVQVSAPTLDSSRLPMTPAPEVLTFLVSKGTCTHMYIHFLHTHTHN